ncbi:MAG: cytoplasmic tRNA 2-thiolation protein 2 [Claussenomyces sp. TS43310]|nr:MAG: cytoplasmic tRNA 2-thiolation protein 2 [Claussenomyces sp. TS43310]
MVAKGSAANSQDLSRLLCQKCGNVEATLYSRADYVCQKCFMKYVNKKAVKRMESYRARGSNKKLVKKFLLPVSLGPSSTSLLYILDNHLQAQVDRMGRTSYELVVVHVDLQSVGLEGEPNTKQLLERLRSRFSRHTYTGLNIGKAVELASIDWKALGLEDSTIDNLDTSSRDCLQHLTSNLPSSTSKSDIISTLLHRLLVDFATRNDCESILFGDSTTRLAEKTLTETAKGRGFSLPWQVSDGMSPFGINICYPMRDLLRKEIITFGSSTTPPLTDIILDPPSVSQVSASAKSTTIDDLMAQYFESVEKSYPSIVANVVRTSSKLKAPDSYDDTLACGLCGLPVAKGTDGIYGWGGDQIFKPRSTSSQPPGGRVLCYGCSRSING